MNFDVTRAFHDAPPEFAGRNPDVPYDAKLVQKAQAQLKALVLAANRAVYGTDEIRSLEDLRRPTSDEAEAQRTRFLNEPKYHQTAMSPSATAYKAASVRAWLLAQGASDPTGDAALRAEQRAEAEKRRLREGKAARRKELERKANPNKAEIERLEAILAENKAAHDRYQACMKNGDDRAFNKYQLADTRLKELRAGAEHAKNELRGL